MADYLVFVTATTGMNGDPAPLVRSRRLQGGMRT